LLGRYQFQSPSSFIVAGSRTARTMVASSSTATARPTPNILATTSGSSTKAAKTEIMISAALVMTRAVEPTPSTTARLGSRCCRYCSRTRLSRKTS
jgi:hypothetical protein